LQSQYTCFSMIYSVCVHVCVCVCVCACVCVCVYVCTASLINHSRVGSPQRTVLGRGAFLGTASLINYPHLGSTQYTPTRQALPVCACVGESVFVCVCVCVLYCVVPLAHRQGKLNMMLVIKHG